MSRKTALPEYYVMLCARRYAEMAKKLVVAVREDERTQTKNRLLIQPAVFIAALPQTLPDRLIEGDAVIGHRARG